MSKHTPGPWGQSHRKTSNGMHSTQVYDADGETIATLEWWAWPPDEDGVVSTAREANARLIAAAPDYHESSYRLAMLALQSDRYSQDPEYRDAVDDVLAAYRKAEGTP